MQMKTKILFIGMKYAFNTWCSTLVTFILAQFEKGIMSTLKSQIKYQFPIGHT